MNVFDLSRSKRLRQKLQLREMMNFLQLYSTQSFWKAPPANQMDIEAVDLNATLNTILSKIQSNLLS